MVDELPHARLLRCFSVSPNFSLPPPFRLSAHLYSPHTTVRARRGGMACAAAPSPLPAHRSATAARVVFAVGPHPPRFYRRFKPSTGGAARSSLRVVASSSKADPVEERPPVAPLSDVPVLADASSPVEPQPQVSTGTWKWRGYNIRYQHAGTSGPALVLIHGFGANSDHWRKNVPVLAVAHRVYAIDLIGYGYSDKPNPREIREDFYTFETWGEQLNTFCAEVVQSEAFLICNSIGGMPDAQMIWQLLPKLHSYAVTPNIFDYFFITRELYGVVGLQAAVMEPEKCKGIVLLDISLRTLHIKKQPWFAKPFIKSFQSLLRNTVVGKLFFNAVATPQSVKNILCQCYRDTSAVTDELVQIILQPGLDPGAVDVFLEFICYSGGPLPEELLPLVKCPVLVAWGEKDPWEPVELGRAYSSFDTVEDFIVLPDVGHCPQDEAPELVNPLVESFVQRHT